MPSNSGKFSRSSDMINIMSKKVLALAAIPVAVLLLVITMFFLIKEQQPEPQTARFVGTITSTDVDCRISDEIEAMYVDDKKIYITETPHDAGSFGRFDRELYPCDSVTTTQKPRNSLKRSEDIVGTQVDVYAQKIDSTTFTLSGNSEYFIKAID